VSLQNQRLAQGRKCQREELKLRQMLSHLLDEEIALDLPPEERARARLGAPEMVAQSGGQFHVCCRLIKTPDQLK
jgi:hypothetical protein